MEKANPQKENISRGAIWKKFAINPPRNEPIKPTKTFNTTPIRLSLWVITLANQPIKPPAIVHKNKYI